MFFFFLGLMGANFSGAASDFNGDGSAVKPKLGDIPESCVALVLSYLDPPEICNLARTNQAFRGASSANFIWESKLPVNYRDIVERVLDNPKVLNLEKKDIYARLCRTNPFDGGTKVLILAYPASVPGVILACTMDCGKKEILRIQ